MTNNIEYKGYNITIEQDEYAENPRRDFDHFGVFTMAHRNYDFADKGNNFKSGGDMIADVKRYSVISLPVYMYDHSGITINTGGFNCRWDSGQIGFIYATAKAIRENYAGNAHYCFPCLNGKTDAQITEYVKNPPNLIWKKLQSKIIGLLEAEIKELDQYLTGDIYHYRIENNGEDVDSCGGFYGYDDCLKEAKGTVDWHFKTNYPILAA